MARDETRFISGDEARRLRAPGQRIIENPGVLDRESARETDEGIPSPPAVVETTPTADGRTPAENRDISQQQAAAEIARVPAEEGDQGRADSPALSSDDAGTGSSATYPQEGADARRENPEDPTAAREAAVARPAPPHYFVERKHQAFYHDAIIYIEGQEISDYLLGTISITYGLGSSPNKCEFKLDNAGHKFTLTPENIQEGIFRTAEQTRGLGSGFDYSELAKKEIFDRKSNPGHNPVDNLSGGRRFPLHHWSTVFHKTDSVRVWIHNPASERDEWLPVFTGYVINKPISEDFITGENTISVSCQDIRYLMQKMRVNTNSVLAVLPGQQQTTAADPTNTQPFTGLRIFHPQANQQFNQSFFTDLVVASQYNNPWSTLTFRQLVAALTFVNNVTNLVAAAGATVQSRVNRARTTEIRALGREISPLHQRVNAPGRPLSPSEQSRYDRLLNEISQNGATADQAISGTIPEVDVVGPGGTPPATSDVTTTTNPSTDPTPPPGGTNTPTRIQERSAPPRGAGRIGRFRPGVYPWFSRSVNNEPVTDHALTTRRGYAYPPADSEPAVIKAFWQNWYNLCLFGTPIRENIQTTQFVPGGPSGRRRGAGVGVEVSDGVLDHSLINRRYWTEAQVHAAGEGTRREGLWQTDTQAVHMILPGRRAPTSDLIFELSIIGASNVQSNLNWTNRLALLNDACDNVDYRFWVSGTGDLIFEFAQYDFDPRDYGAYEGVLTLDHHLLNESFDEEGGEVVTAVVANGSYVGLGNIDENQLAQFIPRSVGVWSPNLASRHGLNVRVKNYPQITITSRLRRLAALEFQKLLAAADEYSIGVAFRPWLLLNKPVFNKYRDRYALIDGIRWTLPVTAGSVAGQQVPTYSLTLNYSRSFDEIGIPRYITGGPSQPMYYGALRGRTSIASRLAERITSFRAAINDLRSSETTTIEDFEELRRSYSALLPVSQASHNVINASFQASVFEDRPEGEVSTVSQELRAAQAECNELITDAGSFSEEERERRLASCDERLAAANAALREQGEPAGPEQDADGGSAPDVGRSGVRTTLDGVEDQEAPPEGPPPEDGLCHPGPPNVFSSPLGRVQRTWSGQGGVVFMEEGDFPRYQGNGFGMRERNFQHMGADYYTAFGEPVYAVADGVVIQANESRTFGSRIGIMHSGGFVTFNRHLKDLLVSRGDEVKRHQHIGNVGNTNGENSVAHGGVHLHFETGAVEGSPAFNRYVSRSGNDTRFRIVRPRRTGGGRNPDGTRNRGQTQDDAPQDQQGYASFRVLANYGPRLTVTADQRTRFDLGFLGEEFRLSNLFLFWSPTCYGEDPFNAPETRGNRNTTRPDASATPLLSPSDFLEQHGLKSVPAVLEKKVPHIPRRLRPPSRSRVRGSPFWLVPDPPPSDATDRRRTRLQRNRDTAIAKNEELMTFLAANDARFAEQLLLFRASVPPEDCPPESYEGTTPRQPGEPLPDRRRITRAEARAAYSPREGTSGGGGSSV